MATSEQAPQIITDDHRLADAFRHILYGRISTSFALLVVLIFIFVAAFAPWLAPYDPLAQSILAINQKPSAAHWLGTDQFGRDVLSRMIYGSRNSLIFGFISPVLAAIFGTLLGVTAGYFGGITDRIISRLIDLLLAFPELLLAIIIAAVLGGGFWNIIAVITVAFIPGFARVARASTLAVKQEPYVEAAIAVGVRTPVIIFRHIIPNIAAPIVVLMTLWVASAIRSVTPCATCSIRRRRNEATLAERRASAGRIRNGDEPCCRRRRCELRDRGRRSGRYCRRVWFRQVDHVAIDHAACAGALSDFRWQD